jgi:nitrate reductase (cytochrome), electron transfer subunit
MRSQGGEGMNAWRAGLLLVAAVALGGCGEEAPPPPVSDPAPAAPQAALESAAEPVPEGPGIDAMRRGIALQTEGEPLAIARVDNRDLRRERAYPMQPPTIPHAIDNYQLDRNVNKCMDCHSRAAADEFQAVPVSVTHYMDRNENFLAAISPRRYFCTACHVVQHDAPVLVANEFVDVDTLLERSRAPAEEH